MTMIAMCELALPVGQNAAAVVVAGQPASVHRDTQTASLLRVCRPPLGLKTIFKAYIHLYSFVFLLH
jgi:hypothetical protein